MALDTLITGGRVIDGSGNPWFRGDVGLAGDRIAAIAAPGTIPLSAARSHLDVADAVVCPGFIDIQSHSIYCLMVDGRCVSKITQGITTEIMGEAWTPAPVLGRYDGGVSTHVVGDVIADWVDASRGWSRFAHWLEAFEASGVSPNVGSYLGGGTLRKVAKGMDSDPATAADRTLMRRTMAEAMEDGAFGVSYALIYAPDCYVDVDEIVDVCEIVGSTTARISPICARRRVRFSAPRRSLRNRHPRRRARGDLPPEVVGSSQLGQDAACHRAHRSGARRRPRCDGGHVSVRCLRYGAHVGIATMGDGVQASSTRICRTRQHGPAFRAAATKPDGTWAAMVDQHGEDGVMPIGFKRPENQQYVGRKLAEICRMRGQDWFDAVCDLVLSERQSISTIYFSMLEDNLRLQLQQP